MMKKIRSRSADSNKSGASKFEGEELDTESFTEAEERIRALGEVTEHLDKREVSGEILDDAIKSLFDKYTKDREKDKVDPTIFTNTDKYTIRDFLENCNSLVESLEFQISEKEFEILLMGRLAPNIRSVMNLHRTESLESLYVNLLNLYDQSESRLSAFGAIANCNKNKFTSLRTYLEEILRLIGLSGKSKEQKVNSFCFQWIWFYQKE